jgi:hypothetical protein
VAIGGGSYLLLHKNKTTNTSTVATTKTSSAQKQLNLSLLLANLQKQYPTVQQTYIYSTNQDPNNELGKAGGYVSGAEFYDTRTNTPPSESESAGSTAFGADCGGAIEVYPNSSDAASRASYLESFQNDAALNPGAVKQVDNVVVRASENYTGPEQTDMINYLASQVQDQLQ